MPSSENTTYLPEVESVESLAQVKDALNNWFSKEIERETWRQNMLESACLFQFGKANDSVLSGRIQQAIAEVVEEVPV